MLWDLRWSRIMHTEVHPIDWLALDCGRALSGALGGLGAGWGCWWWCWGVGVICIKIGWLHDAYAPRRGKPSPVLSWPTLWNADIRPKLIWWPACVTYYLAELIVARLRGWRSGFRGTINSIGVYFMNRMDHKACTGKKPCGYFACSFPVAETAPWRSSQGRQGFNNNLKMKESKPKKTKIMKRTKQLENYTNNSEFL